MTWQAFLDSLADFSRQPEAGRDGFVAFVAARNDLTLQEAADAVADWTRRVQDQRHAA